MDEHKAQLDLLLEPGGRDNSGAGADGVARGVLREITGLLHDCAFETLRCKWPSDRSKRDQLMEDAQAKLDELLSKRPDAAPLLGTSNRTCGCRRRPLSPNPSPP